MASITYTCILFALAGDKTFFAAADAATYRSPKICRYAGESLAKMKKWKDWECECRRDKCGGGECLQYSFETVREAP